MRFCNTVYDRCPADAVHAYLLLHLALYVRVLRQVQQQVGTQVQQLVLLLCDSQQTPFLLASQPTPLLGSSCRYTDAFLLHGETLIHDTACTKFGATLICNTACDELDVKV